MDKMVRCFCRICNNKLISQFLDLGYSPLANSYLTKKNKDSLKNKNFPLKVYFCEICKLVQLPEHENPKNIFSNYDYLSSPSISWLNHSKKYVLETTNKFFNKSKKKIKVCELASNDGYLLQYFDKKKFEILGIEPAKNIAKIAIKKNIPTIPKFFGSKLAKKLKIKKGSYDLIIGNNVFAHVPNIRDFAKGIYILLSKNGFATLEFPHLLNLIRYKQFDTIYHEHFSYLSIKSINFLFKKLNLQIFDIKKLNTHGGSLRIYVKKKSAKFVINRKLINKILKEENKAKIFSKNTFQKLQSSIDKNKELFINLLIKLKLQSKKVVAYGAPAKGNTFLNFCSVDHNLIDFTVDRANTKIGKFLPGSKIPIFHPDKLVSYRPDYIIILPWNLRKEIISQLKKKGIKSKFITCIPNLKIIN